MFSRDSIRFRSFEDDLIDETKWKQKDIILKELDLPALNTPIEQQLRDFKIELEDKYREVNRRIEKGENKHIKVKGKGDKTQWTLPYKKAEEKVNNLIYEQLTQIGISDLMQFVNTKTYFMRAFTHTLERYSKSAADDSVITACILACGNKPEFVNNVRYIRLKFQYVAYGLKQFYSPGNAEKCKRFSQQCDRLVANI